MTDSFYQILVFTLTASVFGSTLLLLSLVMQKLFGIGTPRKIKMQSYECGVKQIGKSLIKFDIKYYLFGLLFLVFDVEFIFLIPWAMYFTRPEVISAQHGHLSLFLLLEAIIFITILGIGWLYAKNTKALEWN